VFGEDDDDVILAARDNRSTLCPIMVLKRSLAQLRNMYIYDLMALLLETKLVQITQ
jgi:hypothetical protein